MELLFALALLVPLAVIVQRLGKGTRAFTHAWGFLFLLACFFRVSVAFAGENAPGLFRALLVLAAFSSLAFFRWEKPGRRFWLHLPLIACASLLLLHGYFPHFDVDSTGYHMPSVQWLIERPTLPAFQQRPENITVCFLWMGFEELLTIPGLGLDLPLFTGLVGVILKLLTMLTVVSLVPKRAPSLRFAAAFLILIDDHFYFSGQSRFVYLNPSLIGLVALLAWHSWRALRGKLASIYPAFAFCLALPAIKYHGLYFSLAGGLAILFSMGGKKRLPPPPKLADLFMVIAGAALSLAVLLPHFLEGGSPLLPFSIGPFHANMPNRGMEYLTSLHSSLLAAASEPLRRMIFPGNLALKIAVVLMFLVPFAWLVPKRFRISRRWLSLATIGFSASLLWPILAQYLIPGESRYPRYVFGLTTLAICAFALALRRPALRFVPLRKQLPTLEFIVGVALAGWLIATIDTRYFNVPIPQRPSWGDVWKLTEYRGMSSIDPSAPHMAVKLMPYAYDEIPAWQECLKKESAASGLRLLRGDHLVSYSPFMTFPAQMVAPMALQASLLEGAGYLRLTGNSKSLREFDMRYAMIPKGAYPDFIKLGALGEDGALVPLKYDPKVICETPQMQLVRIL